MAYWCIASAPILAGTDIVHASNETLAILTAAEYLEVNQDLGLNDKIQGVLATPNVGVPGPEVWVKHLADGKRIAVLLVNGGNNASDVTVSWTQLGLPPNTKATVRDLWHQQAVDGTVTGSFTAKNVATHDHMFVTVTPVV
jgi:hypothetical protein